MKSASSKNYRATVEPHMYLEKFLWDDCALAPFSLSWTVALLGNFLINQSIDVFILRKQSKHLWSFLFWNMFGFASGVWKADCGNVFPPPYCVRRGCDHLKICLSYLNPGHCPTQQYKTQGKRTVVNRVHTSFQCFGFTICFLFHTPNSDWKQNFISQCIIEAHCIFTYLWQFFYYR